MFTGIITAVGTIRDVAIGGGGCDLVVSAPWTDIDLGESIAVDGACLTVTIRDAETFGVHVIRTSLERTNFSGYVVGRPVNLERALQVGDRFGGHLVQGHVDGIGAIAGIRQRDDATLVDVRIPPEVAGVSILLGSIAIDGVALTINAIPAPGVVQVSLIPFTLEHTTLGGRIEGDLVHVEGDTVGKYLKHLSAAWRSAVPQ